MHTFMHVLHAVVLNFMTLLLTDGLGKLLICVTSCKGVLGCAFEYALTHIDKHTQRAGRLAGHLGCLPGSRSNFRVTPPTDGSHSQNPEAVSFIFVFHPLLLQSHTHSHTLPHSHSDAHTQVALNRKISIHPRAPRQIHPTCRGYK